MISRRQIISRYAGPIFAIFTSNESVLGVDDRSGPFFLIFQGTLSWQPIKVKKSASFYGPIYFVALLLGNGLQYHNSDFKRLDRMNFSTSCTILVTFGLATSEFTLLTIAPFVAIWQKSAYHTKYPRMS